MKRQNVMALLVLLVCTVLSIATQAQAQDPVIDLQALLATEGAAANPDAAAAAAEPAAPEPVVSATGRVVLFGKERVDNLWVPERRGQLLPAPDASFWRCFMHGQTDIFTRIVPWQLVLSEEQVECLDETATVDNNFKKSTFSSLRVAGGAGVVPAKPIIALEQLEKLRGRMIRVFVWIKGKDTGADAALWHSAPTVSLHLKDANDKLVHETTGVFRTRGTFPWFCYYVDMPIYVALKTTPDVVADAAADAETPAETPEDQLGSFADLLKTDDGGNDDIEALDDFQVSLPQGGGLYVHLNNPQSGTAWFADLSWKEINPRDTFANVSQKELRVDPQTGSLAPNPDYDELPMHIFFGLSKNRPWNFLGGTAALPDLSRNQHLEAYMETVEDDWMHMLHAVPYLAYIYNTGQLLKCTPTFEDEWSQRLLQRLQSLQDPRTGLWTANDRPNLLVTRRIVENSFHTRYILRSDRPEHPTPWLCVNNTALPMAAQLCESILKVQRRDMGGSKLAGWNIYAFQPDDLAAPGQDNRGDLCATDAAVNILRHALPQLPPPQQKEVQEAIYGAWDFVMGRLVQPNGLWRQQDGDVRVSHPRFFYSFIEATPWLEFRQNGEEAPSLSVDFITSNRLRIGWPKPLSRYVAVRIYMAPGDLPQSDLREEHIVAIIQPNSSSLLAFDPLLAMQSIAKAGYERWGVTPESEGATYTAEKLRLLSPKVQVVPRGKQAEITIPTPEASQTPHKLYAAAINRYGEMTSWFAVPDAPPPAPAAPAAQPGEMPPGDMGPPPDMPPPM
ncbi:MAG: hypothetical protein ACOX9E_04745 [Lentisphaeria bacterium]|jgi:hypothetical protein